MSNSETPTTEMLDVFERLEAENTPTQPADPELAELVAGDPAVAAYARDLESVRHRMGADAAPTLPPAHRFDALSDAVMKEVVGQPSQQRGGAAPGFMDRVRTFFSSFGLPQMALVAAVVAIGVVAWVLVASNASTAAKDSPDSLEQGPESIAVDDGINETDPARLDDAEPNDDLESAIAALDFDDDVVEDEAFEGLALLASSDDGDNAPDDGLYDELETLSYAELEALDAELADL